MWTVGRPLPSPLGLGNEAAFRSEDLLPDIETATYCVVDAAPLANDSALLDRPTVVHQDLTYRYRGAVRDERPEHPPGLSLLAAAG